MELYPMLLNPLYFQTDWGGGFIPSIFGRSVDNDTQLGESWELCDRDGFQTAVVNGLYAGRSLRELVEKSPKEMVSPKHQASESFPLWIKLIDASERMPLSVHPGDEFCRDYDGYEPKTEFWYVLAAAPGADVVAGLKDSSTKQTFMKALYESDLLEQLQVYPSRPGDSFFIPYGRIHSAGGGNILFEVQQNSDSEFEVYDWSNPEQSLKSPLLETGLRAVNFIDRMQPRVSGDCSAITRNKRTALVTNCPYFTVEELRLCTTYCDDTMGESFHYLFGVNQGFTISYEHGELDVPHGRGVLIPAGMGSYKLDVHAAAVVLKTRL